LCLVLLAFELARSPPVTRTVGVATAAKATSLELSTGVGSAEVASGTGCHNWDTVSMKYFIAKNEDHCVQACREKKGCIAVNFQVIPCSHDDIKYHGVVNGCHLLSKSCNRGKNHCWALVKLPENKTGDSEADIDAISEGADEADSKGHSGASGDSSDSEDGSDSGESSSSGDGSDSGTAPSGSGQDSGGSSEGGIASLTASGYPPDATGAVVFADYAAVQFDV
jgi:hypothetical protein